MHRLFIVYLRPGLHISQSIGDYDALLSSQIREDYLLQFITKSQPSLINLATTKKRYSDTTIQRYTEPEPEPELEPCINYANYCLQSPRETSVIIFSGGEGAYT